MSHLSDAWNVFEEALVANLKRNRIPTLNIDGEKFYCMRLPAARLQSAFDQGLAPFNWINGEPDWIECAVPGGYA